MFRGERGGVEAEMLTIKSRNETRSVGCDGRALNVISDYRFVVYDCKGKDKVGGIR